MRGGRVRIVDVLSRDGRDSGCEWGGRGGIVNVSGVERAWIVDVCEVGMGGIVDVCWVGGEG